MIEKAPSRLNFGESRKKGIIIYESVPKCNSTLENVPTMAKRIDLRKILKTKSAKIIIIA